MTKSKTQSMQEKLERMECMESRVVVKKKQHVITVKLPITIKKEEELPRYIRQKEFLELYGFHYRDLQSLEAAGLKRIKIDEKKRVVMYDLIQFDEIMAKLSRQTRKSMEEATLGSYRNRFSPTSKT